MSPKDVALSIYKISKRKNRSLKDALAGNAWIRDLDFQSPSLSASHFIEFVQLWKAVQQVSLNPLLQDEINWKFTTSKEYTARAAYQAQFIGYMSTNFDKIIWKVCPPPQCKFFSWLAVQDRLWTVDRLSARGWTNNGMCPLYRQEPETGRHLFVDCRVVKRIWSELVDWLALPRLRQIFEEETSSIPA